ncbi:phytochrome [alpha proteobacterium U9-1i]|nr:phytochrome [alpha proteobacterium U9-1i]
MPNRTPAVDLTNCDREPIHIPGSIQPHGCLLACDDGLAHVRRASANAVELLGFSQAPMLGKPLDEIVGAQTAHELRNAASGAQGRPLLLLGQTVGARVFDIALHSFKGAGIVEFEPASSDRHGPLEIARTLVSSASQFADSAQLLTRAPRLVRAALGYDRVMIYRFAHDGAGQVIGESKRGDLESFQGQYFPASDIPQQARALYLQNTIRVISDAGGKVVPIEPALDASGEPLDLSFAHLRSVSPIHLEYLRNMGVTASMSISIVVGGKLWGLIACHHYNPRVLSMSQRTAAELFGGFFSLQLEALLQKERLESASRARRLLDRVMRGVAYRGDIAESLREKLDDFVGFLPCDGVGLFIGGVWSSQGVTPPQRTNAALLKLLPSLSQGKVWATHELSSHVRGDAADDHSVAGVLAIPLSQIPKDYLLFFRKEVVQTIEWAGDPNKTYETGPLGDRLTPRKSFAIWKETVDGVSVPWSEDDREIAEATRTALLEVIMRHIEILEGERRTADVRQKLLNEELNHRVKNILALIKSLVSQPPEPGRALGEYVDALKGRIMALAHAHDQVVRNDGGGALQQLLNAELTPYRASAIGMDGPPVLLDSRAYSVLALVFHEMATNAAKYGALSSSSGRLDVSWSVGEGGELHLNWRESGGPLVVPPNRQGFGLVLLKRSIPFDLGGKSEISYEPKGVEAQFVVPQAFVTIDQHAGAVPEREAVSNVGARALDGLNALVVEDQLIIAMDVEAILLAAGARSIDTAATVGEALRLLSAARPDFAVLDVNLGSETSIAVAENLRATGIPFVFATGYGDTANIPRAMSDAGVVRKPYDGDALIAALRDALAKAAN